MAKVNSLILAGIRGKIGNLIIRKRNGKVHAYLAPNISAIKPTKKQETKRNRFKDAVAYAQQIVHDPIRKAAYKKKLRRGKQVYQSAIAEYLKRNPD